MLGQISRGNITGMGFFYQSFLKSFFLGGIENVPIGSEVSGGGVQLRERQTTFAFFLSFFSAPSGFKPKV